MGKFNEDKQYEGSGVLREEGQLLPAKQEYTLKKPIRQAGRDKVAGDKVKLRPDQAERLKNSGHI